MYQFHEVATVNTRERITLPKPVRRALRLGAGGKVAFDFDGTAVVISRAAAIEHTDPAIAKFLAVIERDIARGQNVSALPVHLARSIKHSLHAGIDRRADIEGDVSL